MRFKVGDVIRCPNVRQLYRVMSKGSTSYNITHFPRYFLTYSLRTQDAIKYKWKKIKFTKLSRILYELE